MHNFKVGDRVYMKYLHDYGVIIKNQTIGNYTYQYLVDFTKVPRFPVKEYEIELIEDGNDILKGLL